MCRREGEHTANMPSMVVTLDVSRLSGWLNADACCRVERGPYEGGRVSGSGDGRWGGGGPSSVCRGEVPSTLNISFMISTLDVSEKCSGWLNASVCLNMLCMLVRLDVSRLSGWLKAIAPCRAKKGSWHVGRGARCGPETQGRRAIVWRKQRETRIQVWEGGASSVK